MPTSMATDQLSSGINAFHDCLLAHQSGTIFERLVQPTAPALLTRDGPLEANYAFHHPGFLSATPVLAPIQSLRIGQGLLDPRRSNHSLYPIQLPFKFYSRPQRSWGNLREEPATRKLDWSFAPIPILDGTICTSVSLRTSIRISPDFLLYRHSSLPFGF